MRVVSAESTELFVGPPDAPVQLARVTVEGCTRAHSDSLSRATACTRRGGRRGRTRRSSRSRSPSTVRSSGQHRVARVHAGGVVSTELVRLRRRASPAGPCSWSATSTTTPCGGTPRPPTPASGPRTRPGGARQTNGFDLVHAASGDGPPRTRVQVRARRSRLPQAVLGHPSRGPRRPAPVLRRWPCRGDGRHLQRAEHQPHQPRDDDPELRARHRVSARRAGCRPGAPPGSSTCSATTRNSPGWPPTPG